MKFLNLTPLIFFILNTFTQFTNIHSANILFYFGVAGHSHINSLWPVISKIADSGHHNVTLLTSFIPKSTNPRVNVVYAADAYELLKDEWDEGSDLLGARMEGRQDDIWGIVFLLGIDVCKAILEGPATHDLVYNSKFDLVIFDTSINDCAMGLAHYVYKCPFMAYSAVAMSPIYYDDYGLVPESSSYPEMDYPYKYPLNFYEKIVTTLRSIKWKFEKQFQYYPVLNQMFNAKFDLAEEKVSISELTSKTSLILYNSHYGNDNPRSLPPLFVQVAGIGVNENTKPLPKDLEAIASNPKMNGFIYVSFGTVVRISKSNLELRNKFFRAFGNFPSIQFIWKWEGQDYPTGEHVPKNIYFSSWLPQQDLLDHKRIKGFITHGGMNSIHEATHFGVPMIVFPVLGDQDYNANTLEAKRLAFVLEITKFSQNELENNIHRLLTDNEFQTRVKQGSMAFKDRPMKPIDTAIWWIEYVLRTKDTSFLMPIGAANQTWYERRLLDVWFTIFGFTIVLASIIILIVHKLLSILIWSKTKKKKSIDSKTNGYKSKIN